MDLAHNAQDCSKLTGFAASAPAQPNQHLQASTQRSSKYLTRPTTDLDALYSAPTSCLPLTQNPQPQRILWTFQKVHPFSVAIKGASPTAATPIPAVVAGAAAAGAAAGCCIAIHLAVPASPCPLLALCWIGDCGSDRHAHCEAVLLSGSEPRRAPACAVPDAKVGPVGMRHAQRQVLQLAERQAFRHSLQVSDARGG